MIKIEKYNKTQLDPQTTFERHVYHRDQFAHYLRWTHILKLVKNGMNILDFGCGTHLNLAEVLYRNRYKPNIYLGFDIRKISNRGKKLLDIDWCNFKKIDILNESSEFAQKFQWDIIASFEVIEHIGKSNGDKYCEQLCKYMNHNTILLLSTPNYDSKTGVAANHIINGEVGEYTVFELKELLEKYFVIEKVWGTFASQKDYKKYINEYISDKLFNNAKEYFDSDILSNLMAPLLPPYLARNCLWRLRKK